MTQEDYEKYVGMFETDGWKMFIEQVDSALHTLLNSAPTACPDNDKWQYVRGQLNELGTVSAFENYIRLSFENQQLEDEEDASDSV